MEISKRLAKRKEEDLIVGEGVRGEIVIGAPHHAPGGVETLPCSRPADQNTGLLATRLARLLESPVVIAVNATSDPNKRMDTGYSKAVRQLAPKFLVEIHGHGGDKAKTDIEISAGGPGLNQKSTLLASVLNTELEKHPQLRDLTVCGDFQEIYYKATKTATIQHHGWAGLHIELPLLLRKRQNNPTIPQAGQMFSRCLAAALSEAISSF